MSVLTKDDLQSLLVAATQENEELREENEKLLLIVVDATERIRLANDMAETYQRMSNELLEVIKTQYDAEFTVEVIPERLS